MGVVTLGPATGEHTTGGDYLAFVNGPLRRMAERANVRLPRAIEVAAVEPLPAFIAQDRWVVDCPCGGNRSMVWGETPLLMCPACWNGLALGRWRTVRFPLEAAEIVAALNARPLPRSRNWIPTETVADLLAENEREGLAA